MPKLKCFEPTKTVDIPTQDVVSFCLSPPPSEYAFDRDAPIFIDIDNTERSISANQAVKIIRKLVAGFHALGVKKGDVVCLTSFNDIYYPMIFNGIIGAQGIFTGSNPAYTQYELVHHLKASEAKFILVEPDLLDNSLKAAKECGIPQDHILVFNPRNLPAPKTSLKSWEWLLQQGEKEWHKFDDLETATKTTAARLFSSGTTGLPKPGNLSHRNFIAHHVLVHEAEPKLWPIRRILALPFFHAASVPLVHNTCLRLGQQGWVMRRFDLENFFKYCDLYKPTELAVVPPIAIGLIMSPLNQKYSLKSVLAGQCGAAPLDKDSQARLLKLLHPKATLTQVYGQTESTCVISRFPTTEADFTGSVGRMNANVRIKLIDDDGNNVTANNVRGEILISGPSTFQGYHNVDDRETFDEDGFYKSGDIGYRDEDGKWYIVDRKKELIKVRANQVAPAEVEGVLLSHPDIVDAAVIGVTDYTSGELPRAYVVRRPSESGKKLTEKHVYDYVASRLAKYKRLDGGVKFVEAIPKNPSGKILKRVLREEAKKEKESKL